MLLISLRAFVFLLISATAVGSTGTGQPAEAAGDNHWRVGVSYYYILDEETRGTLGNTWGGTIEYSFTDALDPGEKIDGGDVSVAIGYRRFDRTLSGTSNVTNLASFGLKWRAGAGACPGREGLYGGIGAAAAVLSIRPNPFDNGSRYGVTRLEWSLIGGANIARNLYVEISYSSLPPISSIDLPQMVFTFGGRF